MTIDSKDDLTRLVCGGLVGVMNDHGGAITKGDAFSVAKRVAGVLADELKKLGASKCADAGLRLRVQELEQEVSLLRKQRAGMLSQLRSRPVR
jgi:hypothetical protein